MQLSSFERDISQATAPIAVGALPPSSERSGGVSGISQIALVLTLLAGLTLGQLVPFGGAQIEKASGGSAEATGTGLEFYDAIEGFLISGQVEALRELVHPEFVDHVDGRPATNGLDPLVLQLETLRGFVSEAGFTATPVTSSADLVRFTVSIPPGQDVASIFGIPVAQSEELRFRETLRIAGGLVVERWSDIKLPVTATSLTSFLWDPPPASTLAPAIQRLTVLSGGSLALRFGATHVIVVESGALTISGASGRSPVNLPEFPSKANVLVRDTSEVALSGAIKVVTGSNTFRITNDGPAVARALLIKITGFEHAGNVPEFGMPGTSLNDDGVQVELLANAVLPEDRNGVSAIEIARVTLAPGSYIPSHEVATSEMIFVEAGALEAEVGYCEKGCLHTVDGVEAFFMNRRVITAGEGVSASNGVTAAYRTAIGEPVTLLIVTVAPVE